MAVDRIVKFGASTTERSIALNRQKILRAHMHYNFLIGLGEPYVALFHPRPKPHTGPIDDLSPYLTATHRLVAFMDDTSDWKEQVGRIQYIADGGINELERWQKYLKYVDLNFPNGVPENTYKITNRRNARVPHQAHFTLEGIGETISGAIPILNRNALKVIAAKTHGEELHEQGFEIEAELAFIRFYYGFPKEL